MRSVLKVDPKFAIADGALGFWAALRKISPETKEQRFTVYKSANVLNEMPKSVKPKAKADLHEVWNADSCEEANKAFDHFLEKYNAKYQKASECMKKDREVLLTFYDFPGPEKSTRQLAHLQTTNPIESTFATIRLRHKRTKGSETRKTPFSPTASRIFPPSSVGGVPCLFKLARSAEKKWRRLRGHQQIIHVIEARSFKDGILQEINAA